MFLIRVVGAEWVVVVEGWEVGGGGVQELHGCLCLGLTHISHQCSLLCVPRIGSLGPSKEKKGGEKNGILQK